MCCGEHTALVCCTVPHNLISALTCLVHCSASFTSAQLTITYSGEIRMGSMPTVSAVKTSTEQFEGYIWPVILFLPLKDL